MFTNVTTIAGLVYTGKSWGASWGDVNDDGFPDLWISKHNLHISTPGAEDVSLYINQQDGSFVKATTTDLPKVLKDFHQGVWADYDNDGDLDMLQTSGSTSLGGLTLFRNEVYPNGDHALIDRSSLAGVAGTNKLIGRGVAWLDYNNDGLLDVFIGADSRSDGRFPATIMKQLPNHTFVDARAETGVNVNSAVGPMLSDLNGDGRPELILTHYGAISKIYDTTTLPFTNVKTAVLGTLNIPSFDDMAIADFNNDGRPDFYLTRNGLKDQVVVDGSSIRAWIQGGAHKSMTFDTTGPVKFTFSNQDTTMDFSKVFVGSAGLNLIGNDQNPTTPRTFTLDPNVPANVGIKPHGNQDVGVYIGYNQAAGHWDYQVALGARPARGVLIESTAPMEILSTVNFVANAAPPADQILINTLNVASPPIGNPAFTRMADRSTNLGIAGMTISGTNLAPGDFDNDGDIDIYIDQSGPAANRSNVLLQNQGFGKFVLIPGADGAPGSPGGTGGSVSVADYDRDGSLDIALLAGNGTPPFIPLNNDGPLQLFHNEGNTNNWIQMKLHGVQSNADGLGAKVLVTAGGKVQMREAVNGQSLDGQDFPGIHFGLGRSTTITKIEVQWPSGAKTILNGQGVNQFLDIYEPSAAADTVGNGALHADATDGLQAEHLSVADGDTLLSTETILGSAQDAAAEAASDALAAFFGGSELMIGGNQSAAVGALLGFEGDAFSADAGAVAADWLLA